MKNILLRDDLVLEDTVAKACLKVLNLHERKIPPFDSIEPDKFRNLQPSKRQMSKYRNKKGIAYAATQLV